MQITSSKAFNFFLGHSRKNKFKKFKKTRRRRKTHARKSDDHHHHEIESSYSAEIVGGNQDLLNLIFSNLKENYRVRFKIVCKSWYQLITGQKFVLKLPPPSDLLIRRYTRRTRPLLHPKMKYLAVPLDTVSRQRPEDRQPFLNFLESNDLHVNGIRISQSCNGLLLRPADVSVNKSKNSPWNSCSADVEHYVYNPTTNESRLIPLPGGDATEVTAMNLAFDPSSSPHYKIVSLSRVNKPYSSYTQIDIYSSETGCWSVSKAEFPRNSDHVDFSNGVFLNGAIHWPSYTGETSLYFEVENECFKVMAMPPVQGGQLRRTIRFFGEAGGRLLLIDFDKVPVTRNFDVFGMEDYCSWSVKHHVDFSRRMYSSGRAFKFFMNRFHILSVICGGDENDLSLVMYIPGRDKDGKGLVTYNLKERI
ncbi:hypothetical protein C2S53_008834 [Perilla frutescens var. hirtella]|uniref:F-box domain-containing protein n=1 Tax=Perilla frutescens var. hirtella TaxID=608512 RepID=A0AAD4JEU5_PERFH|nr:hypothetical protein C2S53_008834 [Perilla frutescens var. hirtella]